MCDTIATGLTAAATGDYVITWEGYSKTVSLLIGEPINFENPFNEDTLTVFQIKNPSGSYVTSGGADCFRIRINVSVDVSNDGIESGGEI